MWSLAPTDCGAFGEVRNIFAEPHMGPYYLGKAIEKLRTCASKKGVLNLPSPFLDFSVDDDVCLPKFVDEAMAKIKAETVLLEQVKAILAEESVSLIQEVEASKQTSGMPQVWFVKVWVGVSIPVALDLDLEVKVGQVFGRRWRNNAYEDISLADTLLVGGGLTGSTSAIRRSVPKKHSNELDDVDLNGTTTAQLDGVNLSNTTTAQPDGVAPPNTTTAQPGGVALPDDASLLARAGEVSTAHDELVGFQVCLHAGCWDTPAWSVDGGVYAAGSLFGVDAEVALTGGSLVNASGLTDSVGWGPTFYFGAGGFRPARVGIKGGLGVEHMVSFAFQR